MGARPRTMKIEIIPENARHSRDTPRWQAARLVQPSIVPELRASRLGDWCARLDLGQFIVFRLGIKRGGWFVGIFDTPFDGVTWWYQGSGPCRVPPSISADLNPELKKNETILLDIGCRIAVMLFFVCSSEGYFRGAFCTVRIWS